MANDMEFAAKLEKLNAVGIALSAERNVQELLDMIVREARALTNCDAGSLYIAIGNQLSFEVSQSAVLGERKFTPFSLPIDQSRISGYVAATGKWLNIEDVYALPKDAEYGFQTDFDKMMSYRTKSILSVPMLDHEDHIIGVLQLINALDGRGNRVPENVVPFREEYVRLVFSLASQAAVAIRNARLIEEIKGLFASFVQFCSAAVDARDPAQAGHSRRVRELAIRMARAINHTAEGPFTDSTFSDEDIEALSYAAWLHDIGKIGVREAILTKGNKLSDEQAEIIRLRFRLARKAIEALAAQDKPRAEAAMKELDDGLRLVMEKLVPGPVSEDEARQIEAIAAWKPDGLDETVTPLLTANEVENLLISRGSLTRDEYRQVQMHAKHTADFLHQISFSGHFSDIPTMAADHHEMLNGSGYPRGLTGDQIGLQARILAVADIFDALTAADRPYKKALSVEKAIAILREEAARGRLDGDLVELFAEKKLYSSKK